MSSTSLESKILDLEARLKAENEMRDRDKMPKDLSHVMGSSAHGTGRRPKQLVQAVEGITRGEGTPQRPRKQLDLPVLPSMMQQRNQDGGEIESKLQEEIMKMNGILSINGKKYKTEIKDLEHQGELGNGTCGHVVKMLHKPSQTVIAVKQMRRSGNNEENKRIFMDLDVVLKSHDCPFIVQCLGCFITESDVWICMELMATCFDKLLKRLRKAIPEDILGKVTYATVKALHYLKETHGVIHRDVKPSNILLDEKGNVKLCDFGISGRLVDSKAKTRSAGCAAYMAPERIDPPDPSKPDYDIRADVWSLGITLVELATGNFPYKDCKTDFEVLTKVLQDDPPSLPADQTFSSDFRNFVTCCLTKNYTQRPKYRDLLKLPFMKKYGTANVNVAEWYARAKQQFEVNSSCSSPIRRCTSPPPSPSSRRHTPLHHSHHRSLSETVKQNANGGDSGRFSAFQRFDSNPRFENNAQASPPLQQQDFWKPVQSSSTDAEWDANKVVGWENVKNQYTTLGPCYNAVHKSHIARPRYRYVSPSPPQPPPRRLSESSSVPGSPQHRRVEHFRARFHYTPEPQRRVFGAGDFQDL